MSRNLQLKNTAKFPLSWMRLTDAIQYFLNVCSHCQNPRAWQNTISSAKDKCSL